MLSASTLIASIATRSADPPTLSAMSSSSEPGNNGQATLQAFVAVTRAASSGLAQPRVLPARAAAEAASHKIKYTMQLQALSEEEAVTELKKQEQAERDHLRRRCSLYPLVSDHVKKGWHEFDETRKASGESAV